MPLKEACLVSRLGVRTGACKDEIGAGLRISSILADHGPVGLTALFYGYATVPLLSGKSWPPPEPLPLQAETGFYEKEGGLNLWGFHKKGGCGMGSNHQHGIFAHVTVAWPIKLPHP